MQHLGRVICAILGVNNEVHTYIHHLSTFTVLKFLLFAPSLVHALISKYITPQKFTCIHKEYVSQEQSAILDSICKMTPALVASSSLESLSNNIYNSLESLFS